MNRATQFLAALRKMPAEQQQKIRQAILGEAQAAPADGALPDLMTDAEVAKILRISPATLKYYLRKGPPRGRTRNVVDVRMIQHIYVGGSRRWLRQSVMDAIRSDGE